MKEEDIEEDSDIEKYFKQLEKTASKFVQQEENEFEGTQNKIRITYSTQDNLNNFLNSLLEIKDLSSLKLFLKKEQNNKKDDPTSGLQNAILTIINFFEDKNNDIIREFFKFLFQQVFIISVSTNNEADAFRLFEVLNDRGVRLRNSDILKASNLREIEGENDKKKYAKDWENWDNKFDDDFDTFISHIRAILLKKKAKKRLVEEFESIYKNNLLEKGVATFNLFAKYDEIYSEIIAGSISNQYEYKKIGNLIILMEKTFPFDIWIPPILAYFEKFGKNDLFPFVRKINNLASYQWIVGNTHNKRVADMFKIINIIEDSTKSEDILTNEQLNCVNIDELKNRLNENISKKKFCRYILYKLEYMNLEQGYDLQMPKYLSVEHVLPQNPNENSQWKRDFTEEEREEWTNKLGNLVLISTCKNSKLGNSDFKIKKERYFEKSSSVLPRISKVLNTEKWNLETLKKFHEENLNLLIDDYKFSAK